MTTRPPTQVFGRSAFTLVEIVLGLAVMALICVYLADAWINMSRSEQAINKKASTARALQYLQGRLRRDIFWARRVEIPGGRAHSVKFFGLDGTVREWKWNPADPRKVMSIPDLINPTQSTPYTQCKFRWVQFYNDEGGGEGVRCLMAPLPTDERDDQTSEKERLWGVAMVGRAQLDNVAVSNRYGLFNEFAFRRP